VAKLSPNFSIKKAHAMQLQLSKQVIREDLLPETIQYVAGVDVAYARTKSVGAVAVLDFPSLSLIETRASIVKTRFPYIPTLLSFRETPPALSAIKKLHTQPDIFMIDGHGIMHPYRLGFAAHLGLVLDRSTIGVAKSPLCGEADSLRKGRWTPIRDKGEIVGARVLTKPGKKPVYVSIGHKISLKTAVDLVTACTRGHRLPESTRLAHVIAGEEKRRQL
jgi:deoxyribonuclease V